MAELKDSVVFFPSLCMAHLIPMAELAKLFVADGFSVIFALVTPADDDNSSTIDPFVARVTAVCPSIAFHRLPKAVPSSKPKSFYAFETHRLARPHLLHLLKTASNVRALVLDMFCVAGFDVAEELGIPSYSFFSNNAVLLAAFLSLPYLQSQMNGSFRDLGDAKTVNLPGLPLMRAADLPQDVADRTDSNAALMSTLEQLWRADGFIINTFEWLEKRAVDALVNDVLVPGRTTAPIYCIGPLIADEIGERHECFAWLDAQPEKSVVFVCFGGSASFSREQLKEMAIGLERSGQRFLWVVPSPAVDQLPEGFLERMRGRGTVVESWISQVAVLVHASVGAFMGHCGWNSALEGVAKGIPIVAWPLFAEHPMNKVLLVEEVKLAVEVEKADDGTVAAEEVERKVRWLMESEDGRAARDRAAAAKEEGAAAWKEDGSSALAWKELVKALKKDATDDCRQNPSNDLRGSSSDCLESAVIGI